MYNFDAPIPGQSLTQTPGASPMEHPPQFAKVEDALEYIWDTITTPKYTTQLLLLLKKGMPVEYIVNTVLFTGVAKGAFTVDTALLMYQIVFWQVENIAKLKGVKYEKFNPDVKQEEFLSQFVDLLDEPAAPKATLSPKSNLFKGLM